MGSEVVAMPRSYLIIINHVADANPAAVMCLGAKSFRYGESYPKQASVLSQPKSPAPYWASVGLYHVPNRVRVSITQVLAHFTYYQVLVLSTVPPQQSW